MKSSIANPSTAKRCIWSAQTGDHARGQELIEAATRLRPDDPASYNDLAAVYRAAGRPPEAEDCYRRALEIDPGAALIHCNLAGMLSELDRFDEALLHYQRVAELEPDSPRAFFDLGNAYRAQRRLAQAKKAFQHELAAMTFEPEAVAESWSQIERLCTAALLERGNELGCSSDVPVLIVGMPRSGKTLLEQILASHRRICGAGELPALNRMAAGLPARFGASIDYATSITRLTPALAREMTGQYLAVLRAHGAHASRRMVEFCGLEWVPACLRFHEIPRAVQTASKWQVRQPLYSRSVGRWKHYERHKQTVPLAAARN